MAKTEKCFHPTQMTQRAQRNVNAVYEQETENYLMLYSSITQNLYSGICNLYSVLCNLYSVLCTT